MSKYEILTVVAGDLTETAATDTLKKVCKIIEKNKDYKVQSLGLKDLAYKIAGYEKGWYTQINFSTSIPSEIAEFNRLAKLEKNIIRFMIINLDKDYGANALNNPKKVKRAKKQKALYKAKMERITAEKEKLADLEATIAAQVNESEQK